jgi:ABC-type glutathione transport system ATPase component
MTVLQSEAGEGNSSEERDMLLDVRDLSVTYCQSGGESRDAVNAIGFSIAKGESLALVGESGSGKSTIAKASSDLFRTGKGICVSQTRNWTP